MLTTTQHDISGENPTESKRAKFAEIVHESNEISEPNLDWMTAFGTNISQHNLPNLQTFEEQKVVSGWDEDDAWGEPTASYDSSADVEIKDES